jgi:hypothetical protein
MKRFLRNYWLLIVAALVALYIGGFVFNSFGGGYWAKFERDGHDVWSSGLSMPTAVLWQPHYGYWSPYHSDFIGKLYSPLIQLDRRFVHPTHYVTEPDFQSWVDALPAGRVHPR